MLQGDDDTDELRLPGAKGAAAMELLADLLRRQPGVFTASVERAMLRAASHHPGAAAEPIASARAYLMHEVPFGSFRTLGFLGWGIATAWDHLRDGRIPEARAVLSLLLVAIEQVALDEGKWSLAWLLTHLPEPPWATMSRRPEAGALRPFARLADARWIAAAMGYMRDIERLQTARKGPAEAPIKGVAKGKGRGTGVGGAGAAAEGAALGNPKA